VALLYSFLLYRKEFANPDSPLFRFRKWLFAFRFLVVFFLLALLLTPFLKLKNTERQKPIIAILADKSESIRNGFLNKSDTTQYIQSLENLKGKLERKYEVVVYGIGDKIYKSIPKGLTDRATNLSAAFEMVNDVYYNRNIGAVILASDGIFNQGINPLYTTEGSSYEVYTINLGDTITPTDIRVGNLFYNKIAYLNDQLVIKADIAATNASGNNVTFSFFEIVNGQRKLIDKRSVFIGSNNFYNTIDFVSTASKVGVLHYQIVATEIRNEVSYTNNVKDFYVEVLDGRQKVLLVASAPHPDISALRKAIEFNKNYSLDVIYADEFNVNLNDYSLLILHQLPSSSSNNTIISQIKTSGKPIWWIVGSGTGIAQFNKDQNAIAIAGTANKFNEVSASYNSDFSLFTLSDNTLTALSKFPPLHSFFGDYKTNPAIRSVFNQKINTIKTEFPLLGFIDENGVKHGFLCGEGIWRWKLYDFLQNQNNDAFNEIVAKIIQYLAVVSDKRPFKVNIVKNVFDENEAVQMDAQLYNASFELINSPDIELNICDESNKKFDFKFNKTENAYSLNAGFLPPGNYRYQAKTSLNGQLYKADGKFNISKLQLEDSRTVADHNLLRQLSLNHDGVSVTLSQTDKISDKLLSSDRLKTVLYDTYSTESAINIFWIFMLLMGLLSFEWFIRKYSGAY
jgi:hypothetical protein